MSKTNAPETEPEVDLPVTVEDFCTRLSETVRRPELLGAFAHVEQAAGRTTDQSSAYRARFDEFINQPV